MNDTKVILEQRMAGWLMYNGMKLLEAKPDLKNKSRSIYIFKDTEILRDIMASYKTTKLNLHLESQI